LELTTRFSGFEYGRLAQVQAATSSDSSENKRTVFANYFTRESSRGTFNSLGKKPSTENRPSPNRFVALLKNRYANIDMTLDDRTARNIPINYENLPITESQQAIFNQKREEYMFDRTIEEARGAERAMVICGHEHTAALANRFRKAGHEVEEADIRSESWYIEDWVSYMQRL
jgi:hypothetical protein